MIKSIFILTVLLFFTQTIKAQNNWHRDMDSLETLLSKEKTDTGKIEIFISLNTVLLSNHPEKAFEYAMIALKMSENIKDTARIVRCMLIACDFYTQMGEYSASLENAYHAMDLAGKKKSLLTLIHNRIANAQSYLENYNEAIYHHYLSINLDKELGDTTNIAVDYCNLGGCYADLGQFDSALFYLRKANNRVIKLTGKPDPYSLTQIGNTFVKMKNFDSAICYHFLAYKFDSLNEMQYEMAMDEYYIANTYFKMHNYSKAKEFSYISIARSRRIDQFEIPISDYEILCNVFREEGNFKSALEYALNINSLKDTMRIKNRESLILSLETKYRVKVTENKVKKQEIEMQLLERQKALFIIISLISTLFVISMIIAMIVNYRRQKANHNLMLQLKLANESKESLLSVISHDLRGSVGTLRSAAKAISEGMTEVDDARNLLESFYPIADSTYDLLENLLTWANFGKEKLVPILDKIDMKEVIDKSISHINHLADKKSIIIYNHLPNVFLKADKNMMLSVVRNLLTNAIKFSHPKNEINVNYKIIDQKLIISIQDNGIGLNQEALAKIFESPFDFHTIGTMGERGSGLGLSICRSFLQKQGGTIWAESSEGIGSTFYFSLNLSNN